MYSTTIIIVVDEWCDDPPTSSSVGLLMWEYKAPVAKNTGKTVATNLTSMRAILALCAFAAVTGLVKADDPTGSWLSYAAYKAARGARIA